MIEVVPLARYIIDLACQANSMSYLLRAIRGRLMLLAASGERPLLGSEISVEGGCCVSGTACRE